MEYTRRLQLSKKLNSKGLTFKLLCVTKKLWKREKTFLSIVFCGFALWNFDSENFGLVFPKFSFFEAK